jgi:DNA-3-methyladenine glycosylase II
MDLNSNGTAWAAGIKHLRRVEPLWAPIIELVGPCVLVPRREYFVMLARAIFSQQISSKVAQVLFKRFQAKFPRGVPRPATVLELSDGALASCGLSKQKQKYIRDLAARFASGEIPTRRFGKMSDEEIIASLLPIQGVGRWTAEIFLIFVLNRPDVWPVDDLGVRNGVQRLYGMKEIPGKAQLLELGERWRPWRTLAAWYLWRGADAVGKGVAKAT